MRRQTAGEVVFGVVLAVAALATLLLVGAGAEAAWRLGTGLRSLWFWSFLAAGVGIAAMYVARPVARLAGVLPGLDERAAARRAGRARPEVADRLTALLDLSEGRTTASGPMVDGAVRALGQQVETVPFERVEDLRPARRMAPLAGAPMLGLAAFLVAAPTPFTGAVGRLFDPATDYRPPAPFSLDVRPGDAEVGTGEALAVSARATGNSIPPGAELEVKWDDERSVETFMTRLENDSYTHTLRELDRPLEYRFVAGPVETRWYTVSLIARPVVRGVHVVVQPPPRSGERPRRLPPGVGDVSGLPGTIVRVTAGLAGEPAARAELVFEATDGRRLGALPMRMDGDRAGAAFILRAAGSYHIRLVSADGRENASPVRYRIGVLGDAGPSISLVEGGRGPLPDAAARLVFHLSDDYGFHSAGVSWRRVEGERRGQTARVALPVRVRPLDQTIAWEGLAGRLRGLPAGTVVELFGEVRDNGGKVARTPIYVLRVPSMAQRFDRVDAAMDSAAARLAGARDDAREAQRLTGDLRDRLRDDPQAGAEERRMLDRIRQRQEQAQQQVEQVREALQQSLEEMRSGLAEEETTRLYEAMEEMLEQLDDPALREALERLAQAMENLDFQQMMEALGEMERSEATLQEQLERALELLERLETARELDEAARRAEDLARREEEIRERTRALQQLPDADRQADAERLAEEQREAADDAAALMEQLREMMERMEEQRGAQEQALEQIMEETEALQLPEDLRENAEQMEDGELGPAQQQQGQMSQRMQRLSQRMSAMASEMQGRQERANVAGLRRALDDVLTLSQEEERAADEAQALRGGSPAVRAHARRQVELAESADAVRDTLRSLARAIPQLDAAIDSRADDALREMAQATEQLADGAPAPAAGHQRMAMAHLNDLALLLADLLDQMQAQQSSGSGAGGMPMPQLGQQMEQMGQQQQELSQRIQELLNQSAGRRLTPEQQGAAERLAAQQDELRRQLEDLAREGAGRLDPRTRSAMRRAAEAMDRTARELRSGRLTPETASRQAEILQRLLELDESVNQRDREERRESRPGRDLDDPSRPRALPPIEGPADRLRRELLRALDAGYAPDYEELIRRYFERLRDR